MRGFGVDWSRRSGSSEVARRRPAGELYAPPRTAPARRSSREAAGRRFAAIRHEVPTLERREPHGDSALQHSPPQSADVRGTQQQQQQQPEAGGHGRQHRDRSTARRAGRGARLQGQSVRAGPGLQGECGSGGGREATAPAAAGGPIPGDEGAAEAESGRGSQRLSLLPSSLGRRNQSRGRGWEGSGARAGAGAGRLLGWQLRQSGGGTLGRELGAPGRQAQRREGRERGSGAGPPLVAARPAGLAPSPRLSRNGSPPPSRESGARRAGKQGGAG